MKNLKDIKRIYKIIFTAQDPGGFNAILPVIKELKKRNNFLLKLILANESRGIAKKNKISYQDGNKLTDKELAQLARKENPDLIFTATSMGRSIEDRIIKIAKVQKVKTVALIEFWANYKPRFYILPDYILVVDRIMKKEMTEKRFDPKKLIITGSPIFDTFSGSNQRGKFISFFSQPFSEIYKKEDKEYWGYDEIQVFEDLIECLEKLQLKNSIKIKFHLRTKKLDKFDEMIKNSKLNISIEKKLSSEDLIKKSKVVIGMNSIVLFQAAMMGKNVLSYQPDLNRKDPLISNRLGISTSVYYKKNLCSVLKKLLSKTKKKNLKLVERYTKNNSTKKVINFIIKILKDEK